MRIPLLCIALPLLLSACVPPPPAAVRYASPAELVEYTLIQETSRGSETVSIREFWTGPANQGEWSIFDVSLKRIDSNGVEEAGSRRYGWSKAGWAHLVDAPKGERPLYFDPPLLLLPGEPAEGVTWEGKHRVGEDRIDHSCSLRAFPGCLGGLTAVCTVAWTGLIENSERDYCPGVGMVSFREVSTIGGHTVELRTDGLIRRNGRPSAPLEDRRRPLL